MASARSGSAAARASIGAARAREEAVNERRDLLRAHPRSELVVPISATDFHLPPSPSAPRAHVSLTLSTPPAPNIPA